MEARQKKYLSMRYLYKKNSYYFARLSQQRHLKKLKRKQKHCDKQHGKSGARKADEISSMAPSRIDLYNHRYHTEFVAFKQDLEKKADESAQSNYRKKLRICFRNTTHITAAAGLLMIATVDNIVAKHPLLKFTVTRPPKRNCQQSQYENLVDSVLVRVGFYKLIGHENIKRRCDAANVKCWKYAHGDDANGEIPARLIQELSSYGVQTNKLYRSCFEAVANATEHAYTDKVKAKRSFNLERWWFFVGVLDDKITVLICDLGHGIPDTLEVTQSKGMLSKIFDKLGLKTKPTEDCVLIRASTMVKESRTGKEFRGKGGTDVKTYVDQTDGSEMLILSNHGYYKYLGEDTPSKAYDNKMSVGGTIIQWTIPYIQVEE
ncbi:hypothetical protein [Vibrio agarivorans]|uniref:hypothetical protein n=1 Tax=Vibrio agarivorans TaxID=153622 RepID=UPI0022314AD8|nr:hypothetical protein [Vibrio agarivorans]